MGNYPNLGNEAIVEVLKQFLRLKCVILLFKTINNISFENILNKILRAPRTAIIIIYLAIFSGYTFLD